MQEEASECDVDLAPGQRRESRAGRATKRVLTRPVGSPHQADVAQLSNLHCAPSAAGSSLERMASAGTFQAIPKVQQAVTEALSAASRRAAMPVARMWFQNMDKHSRILEKFTFKYPFLLSLEGFSVFKHPQYLHVFRSKCHREGKGLKSWLSNNFAKDG